MERTWAGNKGEGEFGADGKSPCRVADRVDSSSAYTDDKWTRRQSVLGPLPTGTLGARPVAPDGVACAVKDKVKLNVLELNEIRRIDGFTTCQRRG